MTNVVGFDWKSSSPKLIHQQEPGHLQGFLERQKAHVSFHNCHSKICQKKTWETLTWPALPHHRGSMKGVKYCRIRCFCFHTWSWPMQWPWRLNYFEPYCFKKVHSLKLKANAPASKQIPKGIWSLTRVFQPSIYRCYVSFREGSWAHFGSQTFLW